MLLVIGIIRRPHGVKGECVLDVLTDFPERIIVGTRVLVGEEHIPRVIRSRRKHQRGLLVAFEGMLTPEAVGQLRNAYLYVHSEDSPPLPEGEYYHHQLIGLQVYSMDNEFLGEVEEILNTPAQDVLVIRMPTGKELLVPDVQALVPEIDLANHRITINVLPGLIAE